MLNSKLESIVIVLFLIIVAAIFYNSGNILLLMFPLLQNKWGITTIKCLSMGIGFILVPIYIVRLLRFDLKSINVKFNAKTFIIIIIAVFLIDYLFLKSNELFTALIVGVCEEYLFRYLLYGLLRESYDEKQAMLITALLFGVVLHLNGSIWINLLVKVPIGMLLSYIATRFGLQYSIMVHWFHNMLIGKIF